MFAVGDNLLEGAVIEAVAGHLQFELLVRAHGHVYVIEVVPSAAGTPHAVSAGSMVVAWRAEEQVDPELAARICEAVAVRLKVGGEASLAALQPEVLSTRGSIRGVKGGAILLAAGGSERPFWALEPYVGCLVGCRFCYAQTRLQAWRAHLAISSAAWGQWTDTRTDAAEALRDDLQRLAPLPVKFTPVRADPYHAIEARLGLSRACLEVLAEMPPPATIILTRCALVRRDLDVIATIPNAYLGFSMPTMDDRVRRHFEPKAAATHERFDILRDAGAMGIATFVVVQPMLPGNAERLADLLAAHADSVALDVLHGTHGATNDFAAAGFSHAADPQWQQDRLLELAAILEERGVPIWAGELPPGAL